MDSTQETSRTSPNALQILISARDLIRDPVSWTAYAHARDQDGDPIAPTNQSAVRFCAGGAIVKCATAHTDGAQFALTSLNACAHAYYHCGLTVLNDTKGHRAIMHVFDEAIQMLSPKT